MSSNRIYMICLHCTLAIKQIKPGKDTSYDKHLSRFRSRSPITLSAFDLSKKTITLLEWLPRMLTLHPFDSGIGERLQ
jgi:hypothetical protein